MVDRKIHEIHDQATKQRIEVRKRADALLESGDFSDSYVAHHGRNAGQTYKSLANRMFFYLNAMEVYKRTFRLSAHADYFMHAARLVDMVKDARSNAQPSHELPGGTEHVASRVGSEFGDTESQ